MEERKKNIIKLEVSGWYKFVFWNFPIIGQVVSAMIFIVLLMHGIISKYNLFYLIQGSFIIPAVLSILILILSWKVAKARIMSELVIDEERKEFSSYIYGIKKGMKFGINDIVEVNSSPEMFRFCLKDGTWVSWAKEKKNEQVLEDIIKSFDIPIINKKLW